MITYASTVLSQYRYLVQAVEGAQKGVKVANLLNKVCSIASGGWIGQAIARLPVVTSLAEKAGAVIAIPV